MGWKIVKDEDFVTTQWSGGTTTELAISPEGALYSERDFTWRLSSAHVQEESSDFTALPDYRRLISLLDGSMDLKVEDGERFSLSPKEIFPFDGALRVKSFGRCLDFNLMVRKSKALGILQYLSMKGPSELVLSAPVSDFGEYGNRDLAVYVLEGSLGLDRDLEGKKGELLIERASKNARLNIKSQRGFEAMLALIMY